jgi:gliding motility-associated lipoprotein GldH
MKNKLFTILLLFCLFSCDDQNRVIDTNTILEEQVWNQDEVLDFDVVITNDSITYDLALNIRNGLNYPFRNIFFLYSIEDENGNLIFADQSELMLFDKLGKPLGSAESFLGLSFGDLYYSSNVFKEYKFPKAGDYKIKVVQNMRNEPTLDGVMAVGIKVSY